VLPASPMTVGRDAEKILLVLFQVF